MRCHRRWNYHARAEPLVKIGFIRTAPGCEIIDLSSDEDDRWGNRGNRSSYKYDTVDKKQSTKSTAVKKELDDDCVILDGDPYQPVKVENDSGKGSDELLIVAEKGQVACRDYPHARHLCARFPFNTNPHEKYCDLCHCYVCDTRAPCVYWGTGIYNSDHCHSTDKEETWRVLRQCSKKGKMAQVPASKHPVTTLLDAPPLLPTLTRSQPPNTEERGIVLGLRNLALDQLTVQADRLSGIVKWYDKQRGFGFIVPDSGREDLFVHKSSIKSEGYPSLAEGQLVEFQIGIGDDGRKKAIDVSGPGGSDISKCSKCGVTGHLARNCSFSECYKCGETGHLAWNCSSLECFKCGETGHLARNCSSIECFKCGETGHFVRNCSYTGSGSSDGSGDDSSDTFEFTTYGGTGHLALDRLTVQGDRLTGTVKRYDSHRGFGFIIPDNGSDDLFVHKSSIKSKGYPGLVEGQLVEFQIEIGYGGRKKAINVSGPGGSDTSKCYKCGETGHGAWNCPLKCFNCGETGHLERNCSHTQRGGYGF